MTRKRKVLLGPGAVAAAFAAFLWAMGLRQLVAFLIAIFISHVFYPTAIS